MPTGRSLPARDDVDEDAPTREFVRPGAGVGMPPGHVRRFAQALAPFLAEELALSVPRGASIPPADVSRRRGKEMKSWRRERRADEYSARTESEDPGGESSWSKQQAAELLGILKRKRKLP